MITIFPVGTLSILALVELLSGAAGDKLHRRRNLSVPLISYQQMNVIGRCYVIQYGQTVSPPRFEQPVTPPFSILGELQQERFLVTPVRDVPDIVGAGDTIGSRHADSLIRVFGCRKGTLTARYVTNPYEKLVKSSSSEGPTPEPKVRSQHEAKSCSCSSDPDV